MTFSTYILEVVIALCGATLLDVLLAEGEIKKFAKTYHTFATAHIGKILRYIKFK